MLKKSRLYFSVMLAGLVLASLLITSNANACEDPPQTFLSLYMNSDLVVTARYESNGEAKKTNEDEYGYSLETPRNLVISKVYKGQKDLSEVSFIYTDWVSNPTNGEVTASEEDYHEGENYFDVSKMKIGSEYLFFLTKNKENGEYGVTDYVSGVKETAQNISLYEKNLSELAEIVAAKKNQSAKLAEWLVKNIEEPLMRDDAISDLSESFSRMRYPEEGITDKAGPFVVNDGYGVYTVGVAAKLSPTQLNRVSNALYPMLQEAWFAPEARYADYGISMILGSINKSRLAVHTYNLLQSVDKNDTERRFIIMEFLTSAVEDEAFSQIYYDYQELEYKIKEAPADTPEAKKQLKAMQDSKALMLKNFDKQFKVLYSRNFAKVEAKK